MSQSSFSVYRSVEDLAVEKESQLIHRTVSGETLLITTICLLDLLTTLFWVSQGMAREANPFLAYFLRQGPAQFISVKLAFFVPALVAAEWYRPYNPTLISRVMRWTIIGYLFLYTASLGAHHGQVVDFYRSVLIG